MIEARLKILTRHVWAVSRHCSALLGVILIAACGAQSDRVVEIRPDIRPQDFAIVPCGVVGSATPCALAIAGGKRVLFGSPAGIGSGLPADDLGQLDAVMLLSLRASDIEGLDEVRNESWRAGRRAPLLVAGPDGTSDMINALNLAFESADALRIVEEGMPPGGFDAALLEALDIEGVERWQSVFDTGDFKIDAREGREGYVDYVLNYQIQVGVSACLTQPDSGLEGYVEWVGCGADDLAWPLTHTRFIHKPDT